MKLQTIFEVVLIFVTCYPTGLALYNQYGWWYTPLAIVTGMCVGLGVQSLSLQLFGE